MKKLTLLFILISTICFGQTLTKKPIKSPCPFKGYVEYLPAGYDATKKYPVIYWLHGLGEVGDGSSAALDKVYNKQICNWLKGNQIDFIVFAPQDGSGYWNGSTNSIQKFVEWTLQTYPAIDTMQMHMSGLSSGGYGVRDFIKGNSKVYKMFSTFTPTSTNLDAIVSKVQQIVDNNQKVWIQQGQRDTSPNAMSAVIPFHKALYALDPSRTMLTCYTDLGHSAWEEVYDGSGRQKNQLGGDVGGVVYTPWGPSDPDWYAWLKANAKGAPTEPPVTPIEGVTSLYIQNGILVIETSNGKYISPVVKVN
jgi:hypothetical protein